MQRESIKVLHAALDRVDGAGQRVILRGSIHPDSLHLLKVAEYQREILPVAKVSELMAAFESGSVSDIDLGMRGASFTERDGVFYLQDEVYIVDGLQRVTAARRMWESRRTPRIGAAIHFNTTEGWERDRFRTLNLNRTRLSTNVIVRNLRHDQPVVESLLSLNDEKEGIVKDRICWTQRMTRENIISAVTLVKTVLRLHHQFGPASHRDPPEAIRQLQRIAEKIGRNVFRDNVREFFEILDRCWGIRRIVQKEAVVHIKSAFLMALANFLGSYTAFWKGRRLFVEAPLLRKLSTFPLQDPAVRQLSEGGLISVRQLSSHLLAHINSGKRTKRLVPIKAALEEGAVLEPRLDDDVGGSGQSEIPSVPNP